MVIENPSPTVDRDRFAVKASIGEPIPFAADIFADGQDRVAAEAAITGPGGDLVIVALEPGVNDRFHGSHCFDTAGPATWTVRAWLDHWSTWRDGTAKKVEAGLEIGLELQVGADLLESAHPTAGDAKALTGAIKDFRAGRASRWLSAPELDRVMYGSAPRDPLAVLGYEIPLVVDRERARFSAWYEFFPRSTVRSGSRGTRPPAGSQQQGTLSDAVGRLDHIADLGFDVVYLPPIHPIGSTARKGPNNSVSASTDDPGSPWAIGGPEGGHTAVHPELGTVDDLRDLVAAAEDRGLEIALDIAFQCSPDHPWVTQHPEWFVHRPDGSIQYAENPPKKYQDIFPLDFESDSWQELWRALRDVFSFWCEQGVRIFRVDNPHTKAFAFWEWVIPAVKHRFPDALFLSEAFTRPKVMRRLAKVGFTQSYTYFPWRHASHELREYLTETSRDSVDYFRPNSWPNTPDILTEHLQHGGRPASYQRAVLAAMLTANWGIYGPAFELVDVRPAAVGSEEYLDSEKFQHRTWDLDQPGSLAPVLAALNSIRREHRALQWDRTLHFHDTDDEQILCFSKTWPGEGGLPADRILVVVNLDPHGRHAGEVHLDLPVLGLGWEDTYDVVDLLGGSTYRWHGAHNYVDLEPRGLTSHVFDVQPRPSRP